MLWRESRSKAAAAAAAAVAAPIAHDHDANAAKVRVLYAGDLDGVRKQFAAEAPQLELRPANEVLGRAAGPTADAVADIVLIDCATPGIKTATVLEQVRALTPAIPAVLAVDPAVAWSERVAKDLRADDYVVKSAGWVSRVSTRLTMAVERHRRVRQLEAQRLVEGRLRTIVESAPVCLSRVRPDGTILAMNDATRAMIGAERSEQVLTKSLLAFVAPESTDALRRFLDLIAGGHPGSQELVLVSLSGVQRTIEASGVALPPDASGTGSVLLALRDITDRRRLESSMFEKSEADRAAETAALARLEQERTDLAARLAEADARCQRVIAERDELEKSARDQAATLHTLTARHDALVSDYEARLDNAGARLAEADARVAQARAECDTLRAQLTEAAARHETDAEQRAIEVELRARVLEADARAARTAEERDALERSLAEARAAVEALAIRNADLEAEFQAELAEVRQAGADSAGKLAAHAVAAAESAMERAALEARLADALAALDAASRRHDQLQAEHGACGPRIAELGAALDQVRAQAAADHAAARDERAAREALAQRLQAIEVDHRAALESCARLEQSLTATEGERAAATDALRAERDGLARRLEETDAECARLRREYDERTDQDELDRQAAEDRIATLESAHVQLEIARAALATELQARTAERDGLEAELRSRTAALEESERLLADARAAAASSDADRDRAHAAAQAMTAQREALELQLAELQREHGRVLDMHGEVHAAIADVEYRHAAALAEAAAVKNALQARLSLVEAEHTQLQDAHRVLQQLHERLGLDHEHLQNEYTRVYQERDRFRHECDASQRDQAELRSVRERLDEERLVLQQRADHLQSEAARLEQQLDALREDHGRLRDEHGHLRLEHGQLREDEARITAERDSLQRQLDETVNERGRLQEQLGRVHEDRQAYVTAQQALARHAEEYAALQRECAELRDEQALLGEERAQLSADRARLLDENERLRREASAAQAVNQQGLESRIAELESSRAGLAAERERLHQALHLAARPAAGVEAARAAFEEMLRLDTPALTALDAVLDRIRRAEAEARHAIAERDEAQHTLRTLQAEIDRVFAQTQSQRQELVAAQQEVERFQQLAMQRMVKCAELERSLFAARAEFEDLTEWARVRSARVAEALQAPAAGSGSAG